MLFHRCILHATIPSPATQGKKWSLFVRLSTYIFLANSAVLHDGLTNLDEVMPPEHSVRPTNSKARELESN